MRYTKERQHSHLTEIGKQHDQLAVAETPPLSILFLVRANRVLRLTAVRMLVPLCVACSCPFLALQVLVGHRVFEPVQQHPFGIQGPL